MSGEEKNATENFQSVFRSYILELKLTHPLTPSLTSSLSSFAWIHFREKKSKRWQPFDNMKHRLERGKSGQME